MSAFTGKFFVLHAGREKSGDSKSAAGLEFSEIVATATSEAQARYDSPWFRCRDAIWWEYQVLDGQIISGFPRWDIWMHRGPESYRKAR